MTIYACTRPGRCASTICQQVFKASLTTAFFSLSSVLLGLKVKAFRREEAGQEPCQKITWRAPSPLDGACLKSVAIGSHHLTNPLKLGSVGGRRQSLLPPTPYAGLAFSRDSTYMVWEKRPNSRRRRAQRDRERRGLFRHPPVGEAGWGYPSRPPRSCWRAFV